MKVAILVLASENAGYGEMTRAIRATWGKSKPEGISIIYYQAPVDGNPQPPPGMVIEQGDRIFCGTDDGLHSVFPKTMMTYRHLRDHHSYDYIFRCCSGSYIVPDELLKFLEDKPREGFYCGIIGDTPGSTGNTQFASGAGYFLSWDLVKLVADLLPPDGYGNPGYYDDVTVGRFLLGKGYVIDRRARRVNLVGAPFVPGEYHFHFGKFPGEIYRIHEELLKARGAPPS